MNRTMRSGSNGETPTTATCDTSSLASNPPQKTTTCKHRSAALAPSRMSTNNPPVRDRNKRIFRYILPTTHATRPAQGRRRRQKTVRRSSSTEIHPRWTTILCNTAIPTTKCRFNSRRSTRPGKRDCPAVSLARGREYAPRCC